MKRQFLRSDHGKRPTVFFDRDGGLNVDHGYASRPDQFEWIAGAPEAVRLLNEAGVPGFLRGRLPLLYRGEELLAVANAPQLSVAEPDTWQFLWQVPTNDQGLS